MKDPFSMPHFQERLVDALALDGGEVNITLLQQTLVDSCGEKAGNNMFQRIQEDIDFFRMHDPASAHYSDTKILSVRRGMAAIAAHRVFSCILKSFPEKLYDLEVIAKYIQKDTNVEIHPATCIQVPFAIDHGHGTVIGATAELGKNIFLYHGVTLGATGKKDANGRRHPRLGDHVFCGNASQILGPSVAEERVSIASGTIIANAYIEKDVKVFINVRISGVIIPEGTIVFSADPENPRRYWSKKKGDTSPKWNIFSSFSSHNGITIVDDETGTEEEYWYFEI